ncbi:MAG TPA: sensor domain-containing diguanylate cyclase [Kofleriaceae bacterium]
MERELWRLVDVTKALSASRDIETILASIADGVLSLLEADMVAVVAHDERRQPTLRLERTANGKPPSGAFSRTLIDQVLTTGEPVFVLDTDLVDTVRSQSIQSLRLRTVVCAPLRAQGEVHGVLYAHSTNPLNAFTDLTRKLFLAFCDHASIAIDNARLYAMSITDPMSRLYNHAYCLRRLDEEIGRARRYKRTVGFLLLDIDHFKQINDRYGHRTGDAVIHAVASVLWATTRRSDIPARYGGDEFAVVMPEIGDDSDRPPSKIVAERIRSSVGALELDNLKLTGSVGIATYPADGRYEETCWELVERADRALYRAKERGRDQVCVATAAAEP